MGKNSHTTYQLASTSQRWLF